MRGGGGRGRGASPPGSPLVGSPVTRNAEIDPPPRLGLGSGKDCKHLRNLLKVHAFTLSFSHSTKMMTTPSGAICAEAESKMCKFLIITATVATVTLAALIAGVSLTKALSSAD